MIVYNTTFLIDKDILEGALAYLKTIYIPRAMAGGILRQPCLRRVMHDADESESYAVQFYAADPEMLKDWHAKAGAALHQALTARFGNKITGFTTLLEEIDWEQ